MVRTGHWQFNYLSPTNRVGGGHRNGIVHQSIYNTRGFCAFAANADKPLIGLSSNLAGEFIILDSWGLINFGTYSAEFLPFPGLWFVKQFLCICGQSHIDWAQIGWVSSSWTSPFANFSASQILDLSKVFLRLFESYLYLTGAPAAELRRHLSNINVIFSS